MATTNFISGTTIASDWLNDVDEFVYAGKITIPVEIRTDSDTSSIISYRTSANGQDYRAVRFEADASTSSSVLLGKSRGATIADYTILQTNDFLGRIIFAGSNGTTMLSGAQISALVDAGTPSATSMPGMLKFYTTPDGSTTLNIRQTIDANGNVAIGSSVPVAGRTFTLNKTVTGATAGYGCINAGQAQSDVTGGYYVYSSYPSVIDASFTCGQVAHYHASQSTFGASATVTVQYGFYAGDTLTGATNNYGVFSALAADSLNDWNFYAFGTAPNYFEGDSYNGGKFGYGKRTGTGSTETQLTSKSTGVTIDKVCGKITTHAATLNAATSVSFVVNNSQVATTDVVIANIASGATAGAYTLTVDNVGAGSFRLHLRNESAGNLSEALGINFAVIRAVQS